MNYISAAAVDVLFVLFGRGGDAAAHPRFRNPNSAIRSRSLSLTEIIILAIVQGLTEFLPVSSSGHLVVANALMQSLGYAEVRDLIEVSIVLHLGTLAAVLVYYRREIFRLFTTDRRVIPLLIVATLPAAVVGLSIDQDLLESPLLAGLMFPVTAAGLLWVSNRSNGGSDYQQIRWLPAIAIGALQAFAILPGISRSGATIVGGLACGMKREAAATFAFLLAIPAIGGGGLLKTIEAIEEGGTGTPLWVLSLGFAVSFFVGLAALWLLIRWIERGRLAQFAYYLIPLGIAVAAWQLAA